MDRWVKCLFAGGALLLASCSDVSTEPGHREGKPTAAKERAAGTEGSHDPAMRAVAELEAKSGSHLSGEAVFVSKERGRVHFAIQLEGLEPGTYAVHLHERGDCSAPDASSAGGHWNPTNENHGEWGEEPFHLGDIGNVEVGDDGDGSLSFTTDLWSLEAADADRSVLGKAIVVHSGADDFTTQPAGAAGERIGCGVVEWKKTT